MEIINHLDNSCYEGTDFYPLMKPSEDNVRQVVALDRLYLHTHWDLWLYQEYAKRGNIMVIPDPVGSIAGFVLAYTQRVDPESEHKRGIIAQIAVERAYRRERLGEKLVSGAIEYLYEQGASSVALHTHTSNIAMITLAERFGFRKEATNKGYYNQTSQPGDAYLMVKPLHLK